MKRIVMLIMVSGFLFACSGDDKSVKEVVKEDVKEMKEDLKEGLKEIPEGIKEMEEDLKGEDDMVVPADEMQEEAPVDSTMAE